MPHHAGSPPSLRDRFVGCLLGLAVGDATGAPFEGLRGDVIYYDFGGSRKVVANPPVEVLTYTDDTEMAIGVAEALLRDGHIDEKTLCEAFARNYGPGRGYGPGMRRVLDVMVVGGDWQTLVRTQFPGGSLGNGAAMRVAPVGLLFHQDMDRAAEEAAKSARATHLHPIGIDAARLVACAVAFLLNNATFDQDEFFTELLNRATTEEFRWQLSRTAKLTPQDSLHHLGSTLEAHRSVTTAIACFAVQPENYSGAIASAISLGDDTDTIAAIAGALSGAHLGVAAIPKHLLERLENGPRGRDYIHELAEKLAAKAAMA